MSVGSAYLVHPPAGRGARGVLLLHAWWGLTPFFRSLADRIADAGFTALAPDLLGGDQPETPDEAERTLAEVDVNRSAALVLSSARALRAATTQPEAPVAVVGFSMGASWGLWLSARSPLEVAATVAFYGTQSIDFVEATSAYQGHFAEFDPFVSDDEVVEMEGHLRLLGREVEMWHYPGTSHWFFESDREPAYDPAAAELAWTRTVAFMRRHLAQPADRT